MSGPGVTACKAIAEKHGFTLEQLQSNGKFARQVAARWECYRKLRDMGWTTPQIGRLFNRDHSTVVWALKPDEERAEENRRRSAKLRNPWGMLP